MSSGKPTRDQADLAEVLELVLDKGIVINADIAITVGETELLGIELRAAIASFETAAKYGLAFPSGTDMRRVERASGREPLEGEDGEPIDLGIDASSGGSAADDDESESDEEGEESDGQAAVAMPGAPSRRPTPQTPMGGDDGGGGDGDDGDGEGQGGGSAQDETEADDQAGDDSGEEESTDDKESASDEADDQEDS